MATAEAALAEARRWLDAGTAELPGTPRNRVPGITDWYGLLGAWCDMFQMRVLTNVGVPVGPGPKGSAWVSSTFDWYRGQGRTFKNPRDAQPGDLLAFEWGSTAGGYDHIGMVESVRPDGLVTIEGNVGDRVQRLFRSWTSGIAEVARPTYTLPVSQEDDDMFEQSDRDAIGDIQKWIKDNIPTLRAESADTNRWVKVRNATDPAEIEKAVREALADFDVEIVVKPRA
jgi:hypothetical protein